MNQTRSTAFRPVRQKYLILAIVAIAVVVLLITWFGIRKSRSDGFHLLVMQGTAFTEALAQASQSAINAETFYDRLVQRRSTDLVTTLLSDPASPTYPRLAAFAQSHDLDGIIIFKADSSLQIGSNDDGSPLRPPRFVEDEVKGLIANPEERFVLLNDQDEKTGEKVQYYLEITSRLDKVIVLISDAQTYTDALQQTGIGVLAQKMAGEPGVEYILYQTTKGIVFASRELGNILAIESDPFLKSALDSDSIVSRIYTYQGKDVLELVRPFASKRYPFGLFRVGLSLRGYYTISHGFDRQMIILSVALFLLVVVALMYVNSRRQSQLISRQYSDIKTTTDRIFDQMKVGAVAIDDTGVIRLANDSFNRTLGLDAPVGKRWADLMRSDQLGLTAFLAGEATSDEVEVSGRFGDSEKTLLVARSKIMYEDSDRRAVVMVVYNVTRFREFEREMTRRQRLTEMGNLAAGVAHEIRNPLNTISIAAQRLSSEFAPKENTEQYQEFTQKIRSETKRLNDIITRFLSLTREESKRHGRISLGTQVNDFIAFVGTEAQRLPLQIKADVPSDLAVLGDKDELQQVFLNLYNNSKEALAGKSGVIRITARRQEKKVRITFSDSGPGIPAEIGANIFTPYFTTKESGTGLGLSTVYRIIGDMGGDIRLVESELGGATFEITLPAAG